MLPQILVEGGRKYSLTSRSITVTNDKLLKQTEKIKLAGRSETHIFAQILVLNRQKIKHRGIRMPKMGTREWMDLKEPCKLANEFCNEFNIPIKIGYNEYIKLGLQKMKNFSLNKFQTIHASIFKTYEAIQDLAHDPRPDFTKETKDIYVAKISERVGQTRGDYDKYPEKYVAFMYAKDTAKRMGVRIKDYIEAQFAGLEWANTFPDPLQLYGDKAEERAVKYCFENNIFMGKKKTLDFKKIKHGRK